MSLNETDVKKIAHLARLGIAEQDVTKYMQELSNILDFVAQMDTMQTQHIMPMAHPLDVPQRLRPDAVTETNQRALFQSLAPSAEAGLYLVPQVIE